MYMYTCRRVAGPGSCCWYTRTAMSAAGLLLLLSVCPCLCDLLGDLEEAVGALHVDGDAVEGVIDRAARTLARLVGQQCVYTCPDGTTPVLNPSYRPTTNGCGSFGIQLVSTDVPAMTDCCDEHDLCYDTCNVGRDYCDTIFQACLHSMCSNIRPSISHTRYLGCMDTANLMYTGTLALGCSPYLTAQSAACTCGLQSSTPTPHSTSGRQNSHDGTDNNRPKYTTKQDNTHKPDMASHTESFRYTGDGEGGRHTEAPRKHRHLKPRDEL